MLAKVENNVVQESLCREGSVVSMNGLGNELDRVAKSGAVTLVDEFCEEREWERKWMGASMERSNAFFYQNVASWELAKKMINPLVLSAAARRRAAD